MKREIWQYLIAIEGIDGSGTTTLTNLLAKHLRNSNQQYQKGFEPTDGPIGRMIRNILSGNITVTRKGLAYLFAADRYEHLFGPHGIRESLDQGNLYITDRYCFSSLAYQSLHMKWDEVEALNSAYPLPGHTIFLQIPVSKAQARLSRRPRKEMFDSVNLQEKISANYRRAIEEYRDSDMRILELDATLEPQKALEHSLDFLGELFSST